ncbi:MAG: hypothetical protein JOY58_13220 [Solirubrobacterales bacterium]|nr:hypothetical protein [Solirubrobacterales bacterium]
MAEIVDGRGHVTAVGQQPTAQHSTSTIRVGGPQHRGAPALTGQAIDADARRKPARVRPLATPPLATSATDSTTSNDRRISAS